MQNRNIILYMLTSLGHRYHKMLRRKKMMRSKSCCFLLLCLLLSSCSTDTELERSMASIEDQNPFDYNLDVRYVKGTSKNTLLCSHGFGGNSRKVIDRVKPYTSDTIIGFNYIDHDFSHDTGDDRKTVMATPLEIMPLIYMLKECVIENKISPISLYGYALGAANVVYAISFLATDDRDDLLKKYNITSSDKKSILEALRHGKILLDVPFKSLDENIALRGETEILLMYKERASKHKMLSPLDTLKKLSDLNMTFLVFFDTNDEEWSNREDSNFVKNLLEANSNGTSIVIKTDNGGHAADHTALWKIYSSLE